MNASEFTDRLLECAPSRDQLLSRGWDCDSADHQIATHRCVPRGEATPTAGPLLDLTTNYVLQAKFGRREVVARVGYLYLDEAIDARRVEFWIPEHHGTGMVVGEIELDPLVVDEGKVVLVAREVGAKPLRTLAAHSESHFLDALAEFAFDSARYMLSDHERTSAEEDALATKYARLAGGDDCWAFWRESMIGVA